jgi:hypothetical protein
MVNLRTLAVCASSAACQLAYSLTPKARRKKLDAHSEPGLFIGYAEGSKAWRILRGLKGKARMVETANVCFVEAHGPILNSSRAATAATARSMTALSSYRPRTAEQAMALKVQMQPKTMTTNMPRTPAMLKALGTQRAPWLQGAKRQRLG